jgi:hypothetical protein
MMKHRAVIAAVLVTYLVISFVPQLGLMSLVGKGKGKGKSKGS